MKKQILIVEDDPILRDLTRRQVSKLGFECIVVKTGEEAVDQTAPEIGLIFMDIGLPGIDGVHATMLIRERELSERKQRIPIVALTGHADKQRVMSVGMDDFLQKPAMMADIKTMIEKWLPAESSLDMQHRRG
ncbi:MAG: response regulator [Candidatus Obscuribacterales bacterium]|nr:MAG: response regulator [Candidatus Melainabacteria bacterium]